MTGIGRRAAVGLVVALAAWPHAAAGAHEYEGTTAGPWQYDSAEDRFEGNVGSFEPACRKRRAVKVQELTNSEWDTVAKARSNRRGRWRAAMTDAKGTFRVVIRPRLKVTIEHDHRCDRFASPPVEIGR
jgi:hypothetical protein